MAEYLIAAINVGAFAKGDLVDVRANGALYGGQEGLPKFVKIKCLEHLWKTHRQYRDQYCLLIDYEVLVHNSTQDGYRIRVFNTVPGSSGQHNLTRERIETYLNKWSGAVHSIDNNEVVFDLGIYNAACSQSFWDMETQDLSGFSFAEHSYSESTGEHVIDVDYTASQRNPTWIERYITDRADDVVSNDGSIIRFMVLRSTVLQRFENEVYSDLTRQIVANRRYRISDGVVDNIVSQGGELLVTDTQFQTYIQDKNNI